MSFPLAKQSANAGDSIVVTIKTRVGQSKAVPENFAFTLDVDLQLPGQGITAIFGTSGSGKTTLLRCLAGLQAIDEGELIVNGEVWHGSSHSLPAYQRPIGYVFQEASLFEHLTAEGNLRYAAKRAAPGGMTFQTIVDLMGIQSLLEQYPSQLSGGERQRVAIARALLINPSLLLMDEPLAALDRQRRLEILPYLERLHREIQLPILYVTHSMEEVTRLADTLLILDQGKVAAQGELVDLLSRTDLPLEFGEEAGAVLEGQVLSRDERWHLATVAFPGGELLVRDSEGLGAIGAKVRLRILARDVSLSLDATSDSSILNRLPAQIVLIDDGADAGMSTVQLQVGESLLLARVSKRSVHEMELREGMQLYGQIKSVAILR
ncbi:MAG: molybdenum ABC transporter ATP-binding protein [Pseudomonadales bacterium]|nr:molybdenum ABC transporter ATP-binding protein [Pseudomonadales bacterium]